MMYDNNVDATKNSMYAYYSQSGNQKIVQNYLDTQVDPVIRQRVGNIVFISTILNEKRFVYQTTF